VNHDADCELMRAEIRILQKRVAMLEVRANASEEELLDIHRKLRLLTEALEGQCTP
jgi:hypothetical protein